MPFLCITLAASNIAANVTDLQQPIEQRILALGKGASQAKSQLSVAAMSSTGQTTACGKRQPHRAQSRLGANPSARYLNPNPESPNRQELFSPSRTVEFCAKHESASSRMNIGEINGYSDGFYGHKTRITTPKRTYVSLARIGSQRCSSSLRTGRAGPFAVQFDQLF